MPDNRYLLVCTVKNEGAFLLEWLAWHRLIGFTDIMMLQNDSVDGTKELLQLLEEHNLITYRDNDGVVPRSPQRYAYRKAGQSDLFQSADWAIALDIDEFLRIDVPGGTISDLIASYPDDADEIRFCWRNFGHSGEFHLSTDLVMERFTETVPESMFDRCTFPTKTIFRPAAFGRLGVHSPKEPKNETWPSYNGSGDPIENPEIGVVGIMDPGRLSCASIHHYIVKDVENFVLKCDRGKAGQPLRDMKARYWKHWNARGRVDETLKLQASRVREEIAKIDEICGHKALPIQQAAFQWRQERYAELMQNPDYAQITRDIAVFEGMDVPNEVEAVLAAAGEDQ